MSVSRLSSKTFLYSCFWYWFLPLTFFLSLSFVFKYHFDFEIAGDFIKLFSTLMIALATAMATVETIHRSEVTKNRRVEQLALRELSIGFIIRFYNLRETRKKIESVYQQSAWHRSRAIPRSLKIQPAEEVNLSRLYFLSLGIDLSKTEGENKQFESPFNLIKISGLLSRYDLLLKELEIRHEINLSLEKKIEFEYLGGGNTIFPDEQISANWFEVTNVMNYSELFLKNLDDLLVEYGDFIDVSIPAWETFLKESEETIYNEFGPLPRLAMKESNECTDVIPSWYNALTGRERQILHSRRYPVQQPQWPSYSATNVNHN